MEVSDRILKIGGRQVTVRRYLLAKQASRALVYYWYQGRGRVSSNEYKVKWELLRDAALKGRTEEALVRIVLPLTGDGTADRPRWRRRSGRPAVDARFRRFVGRLGAGPPRGWRFTPLSSSPPMRGPRSKGERHHP
jgi:EpsI family protein